MPRSGSKGPHGLSRRYHRRMTNSIQAVGINGDTFPVEIHTDSAMASVASVRLVTWDSEEERNNNRYVEFLFNIFAGIGRNEGPSFEISIDIEAVVDGKTRRASDGVLVERGTVVPAEIPVGTVWGKDSKITSAKADIRVDMNR